MKTAASTQITRGAIGGGNFELATTRPISSATSGASRDSRRRQRGEASPFSDLLRKIPHKPPRD